jgi:hypothetical protein
MTQFALLRHSRYAVAADPAYEDAIEVCEVDVHQAYRVRGAGGVLFPTRQAAEDAMRGARGHFSSLRISGAEVFVPDPGREKLTRLVAPRKGT